MRLPPCRVLLTGEVTAWGKQFLGSLEQLGVVELAYEPSVERVCTVPAFGNSHSVICLENQPDSQKWISRLKTSGRRFYILWYGRNFTKEDLLFAIENRVYTIFENSRADDKRVANHIHQVAHNVSNFHQFEQIVRAMKAILLQAEEEDAAKPLVQEIKTAITKLERSGTENEFTGNPKDLAVQGEHRLPLAQSQSFTDAISTIHELERTGMLRVRGPETGMEGKVEFLQGKIIAALAGEVRGKKAIYRMFLWDEPRFLFARRDPADVVVEDTVEVAMKYLCAEGEAMRRRYSAVRPEVPPPSLRLALEESSLHNGTTLDPNDFSTLASVIEFAAVGDVLNYNPLPDVDIYESLISLRKQNLVRVD